MKKTLLALAASALMAGASICRAKTHDVAFGFRMGAGFPGDVNRTHPASIVPGLINTSVQAPRLYGDGLLIDGATSSYRGFVLGDTAVKLAGIAVRPYPTQQATGGMSSALGASTPPTSGIMDVLNDGFIMVKANNFGTTPPVKGGVVYVWIAASSGNQVQGGFTATNGTTNTLAMSNAYWTGPADSNGIAEIQVFPL
jgi:hypothetical protein